MSNAFSRFKPDCLSIKDLLQSRKFIVPVYQRPYKWGSEELDSLLKDLNDSFSKQDENQELFVGNLILSSIGGDGYGTSFDVVDGQQRLTTFSLILLSIYSLAYSMDYKAIDNDDLTSVVSEVKKCIWKFKNNSCHIEERVLKLGTIEDNIFNQIMDSAFSSPASLAENLNNIVTKNSIESNLLNNEKSVLAQLKNKYSSVTTLLSFAQFLLNHVYCIMFSINENESKLLAFSIFESINSKGRQLDSIDLIKTRIFSKLKPEDYQNYLNIWGTLISQTNDRVDDYLTTYVRSFILFKKTSLTLNAFDNLSDELEYTFHVKDIGEAYKKLLDDLLSKLKYYKLLNNVDEACKIVGRSDFRFFYNFFVNGTVKYIYPRPLILRSFIELDKGKISKEQCAKLIISSIIFMINFVTISQRESKDAIDPFKKIMDEIIKNNSINYDSVLYQLRNYLINNKLDNQKLKDNLSNLDVFDANKEFGYFALSLYSSKKENSNYVYWDDAETTYLKCGSAKTSDHILIKTPSPNDSNLKYYNSNEYLALKPGADFPNQFKNNTPYKDFRISVLNRIGNLRLIGRIDNSQKGNRVSDPTFCTYKALNKRSYEIAEYIIDNVLTIPSPSSSFKPTISSKNIKSEQIIYFSEKNIGDLRYSKPTMAFYKDISRKCKDNKDVLNFVCEELYSEKSEAFKLLAKNKLFKSDSTKVCYVSNDSSDFKHGFLNLDDGIYIQTNRSAKDMFFEIKEIISALGGSLDDFGYIYSSKIIDDED